jgi:DNA repair protein RadC
MRKDAIFDVQTEMERVGAHKGKGHRERLRKKFLTSGLSGFHDYEVIELLLTLATPRKDCKAAAKASLKRFKTLQGVLEASPGALCEVPGIGTKNLLGIKLIKAVADRYLEKRLIHKDPLNNSKELFDYLYHGIREKRRECFTVLFLDAKNRVLATEILFEGTLTASSVYPREVILAALNHHAAALIFAHNHPSIGITVHEHLIIGDNRYFSFADQGYIARMNREFDTQNK